MQQVQLFFGKDGIIHAYDLCAKQKSLDILCLSENYQKVVGNYFDDVFAPQLYGKIKTREILPDTAVNRRSADTKDAARNMVRFITRVTPSESDQIIWQDRIIYISFGENPMAISICEPEIVNSVKTQFETLWQQLSVR